jgi:hypothetical protein
MNSKLKNEFTAVHRGRGALPQPSSQAFKGQLAAHATATAESCLVAWGPSATVDLGRCPPGPRAWSWSRSGSRRRRRRTCGQDALAQSSPPGPQQLARCEVRYTTTCEKEALSARAQGGRRPVAGACRGVCARVCCRVSFLLSGNRRSGRSECVLSSWYSENSLCAIINERRTDRPAEHAIQPAWRRIVLFPCVTAAVNSLEANS